MPQTYLFEFILAIFLYEKYCGNFVSSYDIQKHCPDRKERSENNMSRSFYDILNEITDASRNREVVLTVDFNCVFS